MSAQATSQFALRTSIALTGLLVSTISIAQSTCSYGSGSCSSGGMNYGSYGYPGGSYSRSYGASTAAEGYLNGRAAVIDALGNFEVNDAQAAILNQHARALDRENNLKQ